MPNLATFLKSPIIERAYKTFVEVTAAQAALYGTVVPNAPGVKTSAAVSTGATALAIAWNLGLAYFTNVKSAKLDKLAEAIDRAVDARLAAQAAPAPVPPAGVPPTT